VGKNLGKKSLNSMPVLRLFLRCKLSTNARVRLLGSLGLHLKRLLYGAQGCCRSNKCNLVNIIPVHSSSDGCRNFCNVVSSRHCLWKQFPWFRCRNNQVGSSNACFSKWQHLKLIVIHLICICLYMRKKVKGGGPSQAFHIDDY